MLNSKNDLSFIDILLGLVTNPVTMTEHALDRSKPPHTISLFIILILVFFGPILYQTYLFELLDMRAELLGSLMLSAINTLAIFLLLEGLFLKVLGIEATANQLFAAIIYALSPSIIATILFYTANYLSKGKLTLVSYLVTGNGDVTDIFIKIVPIIFIICKGFFLVLLFSGLRVIGSMGSFTTLMVTLLSIVPFYIALFIALGLAEFVFPNTTFVFIQLLEGYVIHGLAFAGITYS